MSNNQTPEHENAPTQLGISSYEQLVDLFAKNGTMESINQAVQDMELSEKEKELIMQFLAADNKREADRIFKEMLAEMSKIPAFDDVYQAKDGWSALREQVAGEVKDLHERSIEIKADIAAANIVLEKLRQEMVTNKAMQPAEIEALGAEIAKIMQDNIDRTGELDALTKRESALALVETFSKTEAAQAASAIKLNEWWEPTKRMLGYAWDGLKLRGEKTIDFAKDVTKSIGDGIANRHRSNKAIHQSDDLTYHPWRDTLNKFRAWSAGVEIKNMNNFNRLADRMEQSYIRQAQFINNVRVIGHNIKEWFQTRPTFEERLKAWSVGEKAQPREQNYRSFEKNITLKRAQEIVKDFPKLNQGIMSLYLRSADEYRKMADRHEERAQEQITAIRTDLEKRRSALEKFAQDFVARSQDGKFGHILDERGENQVTSNMVQAAKDIDARSFESFGADIAEFAKTHGIEDVKIALGEEEDLTIEAQLENMYKEFDIQLDDLGPEQDGPEQDGPEQDAPGHDR